MEQNNPYRIRKSYIHRIKELEQFSIEKLLEYDSYLDSIIEYSKTIINVSGSFIMYTMSV